MAIPCLLYRATLQPELLTDQKEEAPLRPFLGVPGSIKLLN